MRIPFHAIWIGLSLLVMACGNSGLPASPVLPGDGSGTPTTPGATVTPRTPDASSKFALANGCFALKANTLNAHVVQSGSSYAATAAAARDAEPLFLKPTALGKYLLQARDKTLLAASGSTVTSAADGSEAADWTIDRDNAGVFTLTSASTGQSLATAANGALILAATAGAFDFVTVTGCTPFPELTDDVAGETYRGQGVDKPVIGFADVHSHISVNTSFFAGGTWWGDVFHRFGVAHALGDCEGTHGPDGRRDGNNVVTTNPSDTHDTQGWPTFVDWPQKNRLTHQGAYYKWLERAYKSGLRIITMNGTNIEALCDIGRNTNGHALDYTCDDMELAELQIAYQRDIQDYVDAQEGGPGKGWFRIVKSPQEARAVINEGKLAVVPGMEIAHIFNCDLEFMPDGSEVAGCDEAEIDRQIERIWDLGVRSLFPIHDVDSALGGAGLFNGNVINLLNFYDTKQFFKTYDCPEGGVGDTYFYEAGAIFDTAIPMTGSDPITTALIAATQGRLPTYPAGKRQCNARGLTDLGRYAIQKLMKKKIMIELDHMELSIKAEVIEMAKAQNPPYPLISVHSSFGGLTKQMVRDIMAMGGIVYPYKGNGASQVSFLQSIKPFLPSGAPLAQGYGSDINGFGNQADPRGAGSEPVRYPFTLFTGSDWGPQFAAAGIQPLTFNQSQSVEGQRKWNIDEEGFSHYGLVADFVEETRIEGGEEATTALYNSAEQYLRMWERTLAR
ncbi:MAG: peptidase M19 [Pseudomonadota bacterium]